MNFFTFSEKRLVHIWYNQVFLPKWTICYVTFMTINVPALQEIRTDTVRMHGSRSQSLVIDTHIRLKRNGYVPHAITVIHVLHLPDWILNLKIINE